LLASLTLATLALPGCGSGSNSSGGTPGGTLAVGFIYVGPRDDYGYNQAHADGAKAVKAMKGLDVKEQENVKETTDVQEAMKAMIEQDGCTVIFPTSFGYFKPHVIDVAKQYPHIHFLHCGGLYEPQEHPKNVGTFFGYIDECQYLNGIVAGYATKSKKLGFVAAKPIPQVLRNINAFTLGARSVNPDITCNVIFTGDWSDSKKEADAVTNLAQAGVDVVTCHVDSPKVVVENAVKNKMYVCGYHASQAALAKDMYLTGAEWNWEQIYKDYIKAIEEKKEPYDASHLIRGGLKENVVKTSPYGPAVSEEAKKKADAVKATAKEGKLIIFKGPLKNNEGKEVIPAGKELPQRDIELEKMNYLVEGVVGKIG
jgi:simple sugar transport system substrate-binding protein